MSQTKKDEVFERFCLVLSQIPEGWVCSYGRLAVLSELGGARQSSRSLKQLPKGSSLPWFRIVNAQGKLADFSGAAFQRAQLEAEGIVFTAAGRIPKQYFW
jgi:methylated-DNA-protein-cysteine methyltransferase-like protein